MQKDELIREKNNLINIRTSINNIINILSNTNNKDNLSKISYNLSSYYTVDGKNPMIDKINRISSSIDSYISNYRQIVVFINNKLTKLEKDINTIE